MTVTIVVAAQPHSLLTSHSLLKVYRSTVNVFILATVS